MGNSTWFLYGIIDLCLQQVNCTKMFRWRAILGMVAGDCERTWIFSRSVDVHKRLKVEMQNIIHSR